MRAEDLSRANNLPFAQRLIKRAKFEEYTCQARRHLQKGIFTYVKALRGWFFQARKFERRKYLPRAENKLSSLESCTHFSGSDLPLEEIFTV